VADVFLEVNRFPKTREVYLRSKEGGRNFPLFLEELLFTPLLPRRKRSAPALERKNSSLSSLS